MPVKKIRNPKHGKQKQVAPGVSKIISRTTCMGHIQVTENHGAITLPFQGCALAHSLTGVSALVVAAVTCSLQAVGETAPCSQSCTKHTAVRSARLG